DARRVIQMPAVNSNSPLPCFSADLHEQHSGLRRILLVVLVGSLDQKLVSGKSLRPVAMFAGLSRRAQVLDRRSDWARVRMKGHRKNVAQAGELRTHEPARARADVALDAGHVRVGRSLIGSELRGHHGMTGLSAELRRIHVGDAAERRGAKNQYI